MQSYTKTFSRPYNTSTEDTYKVLGLFGVWTGRDLAAQPFVGYSNCKQARQDQAVENIRLPQWHQHILPTCGGPLHSDSGFTIFSSVLFQNFFNTIPTSLCHVIYCCGDKSYPCLVGMVKPYSKLKKILIRSMPNRGQVKPGHRTSGFIFQMMYQ